MGMLLGESSHEKVPPVLEDILKRSLFDCKSIEEKQINVFFILIIILLSENGFIITDHSTQNLQCLQLIDAKQLSKWKKSTGMFELVFMMSGFRDISMKLLFRPVAGSSLINVFLNDLSSEVYTVCLPISRYVVSPEASNIPMMFCDLKHLSDTFKNKIITPMKSTILNYYGYSAASLTGLPEELLISILLYLPILDIINVGKTCKKLSCLLKSDSFWHKLFMRDYNNTSATATEDWKTLYKDMYVVLQDSKLKERCLRGTLHDFMDFSDYVSYIDNPMWEDIM